MPSFGESIACARPCADELGILNVFGPSIQKALTLTYCFHDDGPCAKMCEFPTEAASAR
jgi:hypothetical protein